MPDLDALLGKAAEKRDVGPRCWFRTAPDDVKQFIAAVEERKAAGEQFQSSQVALVLREDLGYQATNEKVTRHLSGRCSCR